MHRLTSIVCLVSIITACGNTGQVNEPVDPQPDASDPHQHNFVAPPPFKWNFFETDAGNSNDASSSLDGSSLTDSGDLTDGDTTSSSDSGFSSDGGSVKDGCRDDRDATDYCQAPSPITCTYTQGYYKNHPANWPYSLPIATLNGAWISLSEQEALSILNTSTTSNATIILADQLIAALENGGANIVSAVGEAQTWMSEYGFDAAGQFPSYVDAASSEGQVAVQLATKLDEFNNGLMCVPACQ